MSENSWDLAKESEWHLQVIQLRKKLYFWKMNPENNERHLRK